MVSDGVFEVCGVIISRGGDCRFPSEVGERVNAAARRSGVGGRSIRSQEGHPASSAAVETLTF